MVAGEPWDRVQSSHTGRKCVSLWQYGRDVHVRCDDGETIVPITLGVRRHNAGSYDQPRAALRGWSASNGAYT